MCAGAKKDKVHVCHKHVLSLLGSVKYPHTNSSSTCSSWASGSCRCVATGASAEHGVVFMGKGQRVGAGGPPRGKAKGLDMEMRHTYVYAAAA